MANHIHRRTACELRLQPMGTAFSQSCAAQFRSAGRRPERASRPRYPFLKHALRSGVRLKIQSRKSHWLKALVFWLKQEAFLPAPVQFQVRTLQSDPGRPRVERLLRLQELETALARKSMRR